MKPAGKNRNGLITLLTNTETNGLLSIRLIAISWDINTNEIMYFTSDIRKPTCTESLPTNVSKRIITQRTLSHFKDSEWMFQRPETNNYHRITPNIQDKMLDYTLCYFLHALINPPNISTIANSKHSASKWEPNSQRLYYFLQTYPSVQPQWLSHQS